MTPEQIERLRESRSVGVQALLAEWEARGREIERLRAENAALVEQFDRKQEACAEMRVALLLDAAAFARLRATWPHIEIPNKNASIKMGVPRTVDPGSPTCLRCKIEDVLARRPAEGGEGPMPNGWELLKAENVRLQAEVERLRERVSWFERGGGVDKTTAFFREQIRAEQAEARLAKVVEVLSDFTWDEYGTPNCWPNRDRIEELLAAAKGEGK